MGQKFSTLIALMVLLGVISGRLSNFKVNYSAPTASGIAPIVGKTTIFYDGKLGTYPEQQGLKYFPPGSAVRSIDAPSGVSTFDTTANSSISAGYPIVIPGFGTSPLNLDHTAGYSVHFTVQVLSETHNNNDRAGFSIIALSSDKIGIELGFWTDKIWAQSDNSDPGGYFKHNEEISFNTTTAITNYELTIFGSNYYLTANGTSILSGNLRDYSGYSGNGNAVYKTPDFLFFGDDTSSAQASIKFGKASVITNTSLPAQTVADGQNLAIAGLGVLDADSGSLTLTLQVNQGTLTIPNYAGVTVSGSGTSNVTLSGPVYLLNDALTVANSVVYNGFARSATLTITASDGTNSDVKTVSITIPLNLQVGLTNDNGQADTPTTLSYIISKAISGEIITFKPGVTEVKLTGGSLPPLKPGVNILGSCLSKITINGNGRPGPGLMLGGDNTLTGLKVIGFTNGPQIRASSGSLRNHLICTSTAK